MEFKKDDRILITGASGFFGKNILPVIEKAYPQVRIIAVSSGDFDLRKESDCKRMFDETHPTLLIHLAGKVGGILANKTYPVEFFNDNILINTHVFSHARISGVKKLISVMGGCSYPAGAVSPISEDQMWNGFPQKESAAYSVAKKMLLVQSEAYRKEYGFNSVILIPGNMYGKYDNFTLEGSHVIPAMIRKIHDAMASGLKEVVFFGTGNPQRDFVYAEDAAHAIPFFIENYDSSDPVNISSGKSTTIRELATWIATYMHYEGTIKWDSSKPDGQAVKIFSVEKMNSLGIHCSTPLEAGLKQTITWFRENLAAKNVRI